MICPDALWFGILDAAAYLELLWQYGAVGYCIGAVVLALVAAFALVLSEVVADRRLGPGMQRWGHPRQLWLEPRDSTEARGLPGR